MTYLDCTDVCHVYLSPGSSFVAVDSVMCLLSERPTSHLLRFSLSPLTHQNFLSVTAFSSCFQATSPVNSSDLWVTPIDPCYSGSDRFRSWVWRLSRFPTECLKDSHLGLESGEEQWSRSEYMRGSCELLVIVECLIVWVTFGVARVFWPSIQRFLIVWLVVEACGEVLGLV